MSNTVNFSELKRKEIRKTFGEGEGQVIIYNPSPKQRQIIKNMITENTISNKSNVKFEITGKEVLLKLIPMLTNIILDLDEEKDKEIIDSILSDSSDILLDVADEIRLIIKEVSDRYFKELVDLSKLPKEQLDKLLEQLEEEKEETPEEKELRELEKRMEELKVKVGK